MKYIRLASNARSWANKLLQFIHGALSRAESNYLLSLRNFVPVSLPDKRSLVACKRNDRNSELQTHRGRVRYTRRKRKIGWSELWPKLGLRQNHLKDVPDRQKGMHPRWSEQGRDGQLPNTSNRQRQYYTLSTAGQIKTHIQAGQITRKGRT